MDQLGLELFMKGNQDNEYCLPNLIKLLTIPISEEHVRICERHAYWHVQMFTGTRMFVNLNTSTKDILIGTIYNVLLSHRTFIKRN